MKKIKKKVLVLGGSGMLGSMLTFYLSRNPSLDVSATVKSNQNGKSMQKDVHWHSLDLDKCSIPTLEKTLNSYDYVINGIGHTKQRITNMSKSTLPYIFWINSTFPLLLNELASRGSFNFVQIGTDCVFNGELGNYSESSNTDAVDAYGLSKAITEKKLSNALVLRNSIVGPEYKNQYSLLEWFLSQPYEARVLGFTNHFWNGLSTYHFSKIVEGYIESSDQTKGLIHLVPADSVSKFQLLCFFQQLFNRNDLEVQAHEDSDYTNRILRSEFPNQNHKFWVQAGYDEAPTVFEMILESSQIVDSYRSWVRMVK